MNISLPIYAFRELILKSISDNSVVILTAETGSGKSTQVPQILYEAGYDVVITQPRRLAARTVAERVAEELGVELGGVVGYRTGFENLDSRDTKILFCTDGLQLVRELTGNHRAQVLIIDEVHEWNINIETLVAWTKKQVQEGWPIKVVLMSATLEADKLAKFYGDNVPVIEVPGRLFPVEERQDSSRSLIDNIKKLVSEGRNILVFHPGKREIETTIESLKKSAVDAEVFPLHGELESSDQKKCFRSYSRPKVVVATNVAQTSITIPDIDAVVDSGVERRVELSNGIEGLYLKDISKADCLQRKGRAGRTKEGIYELCSDSSFERRPDFPKSEIERVRLDQTVLRLACVGIDATELEFFHQPDMSVLKEAKRALHALGAMTSDGEVTKIGKLMSRLPVSVQYARMIVEANKFGVVSDVISIAAILEAGSLRSSKDDSWKGLTNEKSSDLLAELDIFKSAQGKKEEELRSMGIFTKSYWRAKDLRSKIQEALYSTNFNFSSTGNKEDIKKACVSGMVDHLYSSSYSGYKNGDGVYRQMDKQSVVTSDSDWIVGIPRDLEIPTKRGSIVLHLVCMATSVDPKILAEVAPQLVQIETGLYPYFNEEQDMCFSTSKTIFNGQEVNEEKISSPDHVEASKVFLDWLAGKMTI